MSRHKTTAQLQMLRLSNKRLASDRITLEKRNMLRSLWLLWNHRAMVTFTVLVAAIALAFPTSLLLVARNVHQLAGNWEHDLQVQVFLEKDISTPQRERLLNLIATLNDVESYRLVAADEGLAELASSSGLTDLITSLGTNPLPDVILVTPLAQDERLLESLLKNLAAVPGVESASFDQKWAHTLSNFFELIDFFTSVVLQLLLIGLFVLIAGNVNSLVSRSAREIRVIKYIGATDAFVSRPYVYFGALVGLLGGTGAFALVVFMVKRAETIIDTILQGYGISYQLVVPNVWELVGLLVIPMILGTCAALLSCRSAISKAMPDFH